MAGEFTIDYGGARGSNAGDAYHELWAVRHALRLLDERAELSAITVEGLRAEDGTDAVWDGVDCTLFYEGDSSSSAKRVELQQLKYSSASPTSPWTVSRLATGRDGKIGSSPIRKLANAYAEIVRKRASRPQNSLKVAFVTNQPIADDLVALVQHARAGVPATYKKAWKPGYPDLHRLVHASGLDAATFAAFATVLDLQGHSGSRFALEETVLKAVAEWSDAELTEATDRLRKYVRERMLPESAGEPINREKVLLRFGVSDARALFPCPSALKESTNAVSRASAKRVVERMRAGQQRICLHGGAGVGKTTALQEIRALLPLQSVMITFDCYGGGSYLDASALRHRPGDAFLHLSNELASSLRVPLLLEPLTSRDPARAFRKRMLEAALLLQSISVDAVLVIAVDAADNSITAALHRSPPERSFVHDLASMSELPTNVRVVISARTGRRAELNLPRQFEPIELLPFDETETRTNVARYWAAPSDWVEDFHDLSKGIPRVQGYAFDNASDAPIKAIDALRPLGKKLEQLFKERFDEALAKAGRPAELQRVCAGLVALARPIPVSELAAVLQIDQAQVADVCADLAPGVRNDGGFLRFADEDFEAFVRDEAQVALPDVWRATADRFLSRASTNDYAAFNVVPALHAARRASELLDFVEKEPEPSAETVRDPVLRREVQLQRLLTAITVCREANKTERALRFVLIGAEAMRTDTATRELLSAYPELTARYARETASRLIFGDPDRVAHHGALLAQLLAEDAVKGNAIGVREGRRRLHAWAEARNDDWRKAKEVNQHARAWTISERDGAAVLYCTLLHDGPAATVQRLRRFRRLRFAADSARVLIERLLSEQRFSESQALADELPDAWAVFVLIPLAMAHQPISYERLEAGLQSLKRRFRLGSDLLGNSPSSDRVGEYVVDTVLAGAEILAVRMKSAQTVKDVLAPFLEVEFRRVDQRHTFESNHLDAILRAYCLAEVLDGRDPKAADVLASRPIAKPKPDQKPKLDEHDRRHDEHVHKLIGAVIGLYHVRAAALAGGKKSAFQVEFSNTLEALARDAWRFDTREGLPSLRAKLAESLTVLLESGLEPEVVLTSALAVRTATWPEGNNGVARLVMRLAAFSKLHSRLLGELTEAASHARRERIGAEEKSRTLASYARLLIPISSSDADSVFKWAIEAAAELDSEAMDQLRFVAATIEQAAPVLRDGALPLAMSFSEVIRDSGIRLEHTDGFPWQDSLRGLSILNFPTALASAARWDDMNFVGLERSLPAVVSVGVHRGDITRAQGLALLGVLDQADSSDLKAVIGERDGSEEIAEELAHDLVADRIAGSSAVISFVKRHGERFWAKQLMAQQEFLARLPETPKADSTPKGNTDRASKLESLAWSDRTLTDSDVLTEVANELVTASRDAGEFISIEDVLKHARHSVPVGLRIRHLDTLQVAIAGLPTRLVLEAIVNAIDEWRGQPAVVDWAKAHLPELLAGELASFASYLQWDRSLFDAALLHAEATDQQVQSIVLDGIERNADQLGAAATFALAKEVAVRLSHDDALILSNWYIDRLASRIEPDDREGTPVTLIPRSGEDSVARFLFAYLGDVDVRQRWRAAHSLRRLARLGETSTLAKVCNERNRISERAFRDPSAPFYWIAANLWLVIGLGRIAVETPPAAAPAAEWLLSTALSEDFPHLLLREYAADACRALLAAGQCELSAQQKEKLERVNQSALPRGRKKPKHAGGFDRPYGRKSEAPRRFHFDAMDTTRYWYEPWLRVFEDLRPEGFLREAERWILDIWRVKDEPPYGSKEPRPRRFADSDWSLRDNSHGTLPTLENHRTYLEWHTMWCVAGELLKTHRIAKPQYDDEDGLQDRISYNKLAVPGIWTSDLVGPTPIDLPRWRPLSRDPQWSAEVSDERFLTELMPASRPGFVVVSAYIYGNGGRRRETVSINSGLVSPETAHALLRALQTVDDSSDYYLYPEGYDSEIDEPDYKLRGWLKHHHRDAGFDDKDVYNNGIRGVQSTPGSLVSNWFGLQRHFGIGNVIWTRPNETRPIFIYEAWGPRERNDRHGYLEDDDSSRGQRLLVATSALSVFLPATTVDLIVEVRLTKRTEKKRSYVDDDEAEAPEAEFDRVFLLRADGRFQGAERDFGSWREDRA